MFERKFDIYLLQGVFGCTTWCAYLIDYKIILIITFLFFSTSSLGRSYRLGIYKAILSILYLGTRPTPFIMHIILHNKEYLLNRLEITAAARECWSSDGKFGYYIIITLFNNITLYSFFYLQFWQWFH